MAHEPPAVVPAAADRDRSRRDPDAAPARHELPSAEHEQRPLHAGTERPVGERAAPHALAPALHRHQPEPPATVRPTGAPPVNREPQAFLAGRRETGPPGVVEALAAHAARRRGLTRVREPAQRIRGEVERVHAQPVVVGRIGVRVDAACPAQARHRRDAEPSETASRGERSELAVDDALAMGGEQALVGQQAHRQRARRCGARHRPDLPLTAPHVARVAVWCSQPEQSDDCALEGAQRGGRPRFGELEGASEHHRGEPQVGGRVGRGIGQRCAGQPRGADIEHRTVDLHARHGDAQQPPRRARRGGGSGKGRAGRSDPSGKRCERRDHGRRLHELEVVVAAGPPEARRGARGAAEGRGAQNGRSDRFGRARPEAGACVHQPFGQPEQVERRLVDPFGALQRARDDRQQLQTRFALRGAKHSVREERAAVAALDVAGERIDNRAARGERVRPVNADRVRERCRAPRQRCGRFSRGCRRRPRCCQSQQDRQPEPAAPGSPLRARHARH